MGWTEWLAQLAVAALLAGTIPVALRLERALRAVRRDRAGIELGAAALDEATRVAEAASAALRRDAEESFERLGKGVAAAEPVREDLRYLLQRAEAVADRLEALVRAARAPAQQHAAPLPAPANALEARGESRAERDLLLALARRRAA